MNKYFTDRATSATKNAIYWMRKATDAMRKGGATIYFQTSTAAQYAHEVEIIKEQAYAAEITLDWEKITKTAREQATKEIKQERDAERKAERAYKKYGTRAEMVFVD